MSRPEGGRAAGEGSRAEAAGDEAIDRLVEAALREDVGPGDWTTLWTVPEGRSASATVVAKERLVVAGTEVARKVFVAVDRGLSISIDRPDGSDVRAGDVVLRLAGPARSILTAERTALNFLGRLSGVATLTRRFVEATEGTGARVVDTRKTTPGWRALEKAAVRAGGGENHRKGLHDMVLIKDNHLAVAGGVREAVERVRERNDRGLLVEVEVGDLAELDEAIAAGVDRILLDNMDPPALARAVRRVRDAPSPRPTLEASGNVRLETIRTVAETGVDWVSVGALTHSAPAADLSLRMDPP